MKVLLICVLCFACCLAAKNPDATCIMTVTNKKGEEVVLKIKLGEKGSSEKFEYTCKEDTEGHYLYLLRTACKDKDGVLKQAGEVMECNPNSMKRPELYFCKCIKGELERSGVQLLPAGCKDDKKNNVDFGKTWTIDTTEENNPIKAYIFSCNGGKLPGGRYTWGYKMSGCKDEAGKEHEKGSRWTYKWKGKNGKEQDAPVICQ